MKPESLARLREAGTQISLVKGLKLEGHTSYIASVCFSPDVKLLATGSRDKTIRLWNLASKKEVKKLVGHTDHIYHVCFSPDGKLLASGSGDRTIRLWDIISGREVRKIEGHTSSVNSIQFSLNGKLLASGSDDGAIRLWDTATGREVRKFVGHTKEVTSICFSPDEKLLASGSHDNTIRLWDTANGKEVRKLRGHSSWILNVCFSPDNELLASGSQDHTIRLWETSTAKEVFRHSTEDAVTTVAWSPDGSCLFARNAKSEQGIVCIHCKSKEVIFTKPQLNEQNDEYETTRALAISPDGKYLASYAPDDIKVVQCWDLSPLAFEKAASPSLENDTSQALYPALVAHLNALTLSHLSLSANVQTSYWLQTTAALGQAPPLLLLHDIGCLLSCSRSQFKLQRPAHLPEGFSTGHYLAFLEKLQDHTLIQQLAQWGLSAATTGLILARLFEGIDFDQRFVLPASVKRQTFLQALEWQLLIFNPAQLWQDVPSENRPELAAILSPQVYNRIVANLNRLDIEELRLIHQYGPPAGSTPDPRSLLDCFQLLHLPAEARLALSQVLRLLPRISQHASGEHAQTYTMGGYAGLTHKGNLDSLLSSELGYPEELIYHRLLNGETLFYGRESEQLRKKELALILTQMGTEIQGDAALMARTLSLALAQLLQGRGFETRQAFVGSQCSPLAPLEEARDIYQLLYYQDKGWLKPGPVLQDVLGQLRSLSATYLSIQVHWVVGPYWDIDTWREQQGLYQQLSRLAQQQAWVVCQRPGEEKYSVAERLFKKVNWVQAGWLWEK